jgi:hypothetical protein
MDSLDRLPLIRRRSELVTHVNAPDHKDVSFKLNFSRSFGNQRIIAGINLARFQRASECPRESAGGRSYHIV